MELKTIAKRFLQIDDILRNDCMMSNEAWKSYNDESKNLRKILFENGIGSFKEIEEIAK